MSNIRLCTYRIPSRDWTCMHSSILKDKFWNGRTTLCWCLNLDKATICYLFQITHLLPLLEPPKSGHIHTHVYSHSYAMLWDLNEDKHLYTLNGRKVISTLHGLQSQNLDTGCVVQLLLDNQSRYMGKSIVCPLYNIV